MMAELRTLISAVRDEGVSTIPAWLRLHAHTWATTTFGPGRECPVCGWTGPEFAPIVYGTPQFRIARTRALCPQCGAKERHRAYVEYYRRLLHQRGNPPEVLHFAPEECFETMFREGAARYWTSNYPVPRPGDLCLDMQALSFESESCDAVIVNHALCCVPDDRKAAGELHRILRSGGEVHAGEGVIPGERTREFAAPGHGGKRRDYGSVDLEERFAPFQVDLVDVVADLSAAERARFGLTPREFVIVLRKA